MSDSEHEERLTDPEHTTTFLGTLEGVVVTESERAPMLFLHGSDRSCAVEITDGAFVDGLARAGVEIEALIGTGP